MAGEKKHYLVYDAKLMRPGCVILQALGGGTVDGLTLQRLGEWLVAPTPDMKLFHLSDEELETLTVIKLPKRAE